MGAMAPAHAQDAPDLLGKWIFTGTGHPASDRCGEVKLAGELEVTKKITARAYRGKFYVRETTAKCSRELSRNSGVTLRIKGDKVSIEYDDDGWESDALVLNNSVMTGKRSNGVATQWTRQTAAATDVRSLTLEEKSELDALFRELEPEFADELRRRLGGQIQNAIERSGVEVKEARLMADQTLDRMAACAVVALKKEVRAEPDSLGHILARGGNGPAINPRSVDFENMECIQAAALNAGVFIR
jgi:hypothetical protein